MRHLASPKFWEAYAALSPDTRRIADEKFSLLKADPRHPSHHLKQIGRFWSVRVGLHHRALGVSHEEGVLWFWIGSHADYDRMVGRPR